MPAVALVGVVGVEVLVVRVAVEQVAGVGLPSS